MNETILRERDAAPVTRMRFTFFLSVIFIRDFMDFIGIGKRADGQLGPFFLSFRGKKGEWC